MANFVRVTCHDLVMLNPGQDAINTKVTSLSTRIMTINVICNILHLNVEYVALVQFYVEVFFGGARCTLPPDLRLQYISTRTQLCHSHFDFDKRLKQEKMRLFVLATVAAATKDNGM